MRLDSNGYEVLNRVDRSGGDIRWHIVVAEKALGRQMPKGAEVHHVNEIRHDSTPSNLVICPDGAYHKLLHKRLNAKKACGNPNWLKCKICKEYDSPNNLSVTPNGKIGYHKKCINQYNREYRSKNQEQVRAYHREYMKGWGKNA